MNNQLTPENGQPPIVKNYLHKHGLSPWLLTVSGQKKFNNVVVIPAIEEFENVKRLLASLIRNDKKYFDESLFLFVVNNLKSSETPVKLDNRNTLNFLLGIIDKDHKAHDAEELISSGINIGVVDASSEGHELPEKDGGVGLARKIGMDLALTILDYNSNRKKILICLDADCTVENNYLTSIVEAINSKNISAAYVQYEHKLPDEPQHKLAIICYEIFLRYYLLGLVHAGSPFAFPTIGSTMICDSESYIKVGGMNKKRAAEDFYFMEKLAKIARVEKIGSTRVHPSNRPSWRVPFGTGQRVNRFLKEAHDEYVLYDPKSFVVLKKFIEIFYSEEILEVGEYLRQAKNIDISLHEFLIQNSFDESWNKILRNSKSAGQIQKQKLMWFDGFRTLKLIHFLRDNGYPLVNMFDALDKLFALIGKDSKVARSDLIPSVEIQIEYLKHLRQLT
ncbi:MAG: glycosyltransferase [Bacteroidetes bacterium]|nr:glycosyltransferase [Bacteroidota bacterium]MCL6098940.1 glycosyltransferase [Bacteroidota bacterium]